MTHFQLHTGKENRSQLVMLNFVALNDILA